MCFYGVKVNVDGLPFPTVKATNGVARRGWPGKNTQTKLANLDVILRVQTNPLHVTPTCFCGRFANLSEGGAEQLHIAIENGWVELLGSLETDVVQSLGDTNEDVPPDEPNRFRGRVSAMPPSETVKPRKIQKNPTSNGATIKSVSTSKPTNSSSAKKAASSKAKTNGAENNSNIRPERRVVKEANKKKLHRVSSRHADDESESSHTLSESDEEDLFKGDNNNEEDEEDDEDDEENEEGT